MPDPSDKRPDVPRNRSGPYDGLRDLQRRAGSAKGANPSASTNPKTTTCRRVTPVERMRALRRRWPRRMLIGVNIFVALCLIAGAGAYSYVEHELGNVRKIKLSTLTVSNSGPFTVLIVGSDTRDLTGKDNAQFGSSSAIGGQRSDTIMLARVVPKTRSMTLLSIPRDLYVNIAGIGRSRINTAFNSGASLLISTIQNDLGIPINHYVEINFDTFRAITDAVGGVKVWFPTPARDAYSLLDVPTAGCINLTGSQALGFARSRHYQYRVDGQWLTQGLSDLARIQRQQFYVKKMISKAEGRLTNPVTLNNVLNSVTKNLTVDSHFSTHLMLGLAEDFHSADVSAIPTKTLPVYNEVIDGSDVLGLEQPAAKAMISSFNSLGLGRPKPAASSTTLPPTTATTTPGSHVTVEVANGSGVSGQAAEAAAAVGHLGYATTVTGQTPGYDFTRNTIAYAPGARAPAEQLAAQLAGGATLNELPSLAATPYHLELVTGRSWDGVVTHERSAAAPTTTTRATPTTEVPVKKRAVSGSTRITTYVLPGPDPTEAELAAC